MKSLIDLWKQKKRTGFAPQIRSDILKINSMSSEINHPSTGTNLNQNSDHLKDSCKEVATSCIKYETSGNFLLSDDPDPSRAHAHAGAPLDKLAQPGNTPLKKLKKRAKSKYITMGFIYDLIALETPLKKSYWNTIHCVEHLIYDPNKEKLTGKYCNNRWCLVCNRIRTGKLINGYLHQLNNFEEKYFITLTIPNVSGHDLQKSIKRMTLNFSKILNNARHTRRSKILINGIRKLECTYNIQRNDFHPHFHCLVDGYDKALFLLNHWLNHYPDANIKAQDIRPADENSLKELFKYFTKIISKTARQSKNDYPVLLEPLDIINQAFYMKRVFQPIGNIKKQSEEVEEIQSENLQNIFEGNVWEWVQDQSDWVSEYGEMMTNNNYNKKITITIKHNENSLGNSEKL